MAQFLDPETTEILLFLDSEIVKMDKEISGSRNCRNGAISGSRNRRKGRQILYAHGHHFSEVGYENGRVIMIIGRDITMAMVSYKFSYMES